MDRVYTIRTPEMVRFDYRLAGPATRLFAWAIDIAALAGMLVALTLVGCIGSAFLSGLVGTDLGWSIAMFAGFALYYGYFAFAEWRFAGRTFGKQVMGLRVLQADGMRISAFHALARNLVRVVDSLFPLYTVGAVSVLATRRGQRLGDLIAGTIVAHDERPPAIPAASMHDGAAARGGAAPGALRAGAIAADSMAADAMATDKGLVGRMTRRLTKDERELLIDAARRADEIDLAVRGPLFARLAGHYSARLAVARDPHVSDERLVQNLARALLAGERLGGGL